MKPIIMPVVGQDLETGKIVEWLKGENDPVEKGQVILLVESEKASFEIEAEEDGVLLKILHPEGTEVEVLKPVGYVGRAGERFDETKAEAATEHRPPTGAVEATATPEQRAAAPAERKEPPVSPSARRIAKEMGVDLTKLKGSGPRGRIVRSDVLAAGTAGEQTGDEDVVLPFGRMRKRLAERLLASKHTIPHFHLFQDVDMTEADEWRRGFNTARGAHITITDLVVKAAAMALRGSPKLNAHVEAEKITLCGNVHVGVAVAVEDGLLVPVIPNADRLRLAEISERSSSNADAARRGALAPGPTGTFTVTSLGMHGVKRFVPIINPPECAILAVGSIAPAVVPVSGGIGVRDMMSLTLACDHRAVDGAAAATLLREVKTNLEDVSGRLRHWV